MCSSPHAPSGSKDEWPRRLCGPHRKLWCAATTTASVVIWSLSSEAFGGDIILLDRDFVHENDRSARCTTRASFSSPEFSAATTDIAGRMYAPEA